jgi:hypothetical protein
LQVLSHNSGDHSGSFKIAEQTRIDKLPAFYGSWLSDRYSRDPWNDSIDLCLAVDLRIVLDKPSRTAGSDTVSPSTPPARFAALELSAPAVSLLQAVQRSLELTMPRSPSASLAMLGLVAKDWHLPPPTSC